MTVYAIDDLYAEIAYIAYHFHWPPSEILALEHPERRRYIGQIRTINQHLSGRD
ncbi:DUF6760 family protein [Streptomyces sp. H27-D2]|uniref:DUF6760 family protein n=1 Tax=Streptomyces sp. H27-D2 TaxID=3046304 RepID=UPI002DB5FDD5|nr:DUF6760 family protein [Streptomyces sp. H27-D2]MEC4017972.1 DUF6760 family protein [Streptomyces sp. H27-D2]